MRGCSDHHPVERSAGSWGAYSREHRAYGRCFIWTTSLIFPPDSKSAVKTPMLTLLKQCRAFGLGVVLATQNPVDLDYKGLVERWYLVPGAVANSAGTRIGF